jgi:peptidoglycan/LPS O-acetylase OafA/YrhL
MRIRRLAQIFVKLEALFLLCLAAYLIIRSLTSELTEADAIAAEIVFLILGAVGLFFAGRGMVRSKRYGRGAIVLANLIALGVAYYMIDGDRILWGLTLGSVALITAGLTIAATPEAGGKNSHGY